MESESRLPRGSSYWAVRRKAKQVLSEDFNVWLANDHDQQPNLLVSTSDYSVSNDFMESEEDSSVNNDGDGESDHESQETSIQSAVEDNNIDDVWYDALDFGNLNIYCDQMVGSEDSDNYMSSDDEEDNLIPVEANYEIVSEFRKLVVTENLTHKQTNTLLEYFRKWKFGSFPKCAKTLLKTPLSYNIRTVHPGHYWHRGILQPLKDYIVETDCAEVLVSLSVDGLPLARSASNAFWPILCTFNNSPNVIVVGVYYGKDKPSNCNDYLRDFVEEISPLCSDGFVHNGKVVSVRLWCAVCDAPAKSFVLNTKGHGSYNGCSKCTVTGRMFGRTMAFPNLDSPLRTDDDFRARQQEHHHKGHTILNDVPHFGPVSNVPLDYLHLTLLGVLRKVIYAWIGGPLKVRLSKRLVQVVSDVFILLSAWTPSEFARRPRSLKFVKRFKATEFRQILLYTGIVALSRSVRDDLYDHFVCLHAAHYILADAELSKLYGSYAKELLVFYVKEFKRFYGAKFTSHNVHSLIHLADDVEKFGPLDSFSAFKFENFLQILKKMMRKGEKPLQQLIRRLTEAEQVGHFKKKPEKNGAESKPCFVRLHSNGPLKSNLTGPQYSCCKLASGFTINSVSDANNCCKLSDNSIVLISNFAYSNSLKTMVAVGRKFSVIGNVYSKPFESSMIGIFYVEKLGRKLQCWPVADIVQKCYRMPFRNGYAVVPMILSD